MSAGCADGVALLRILGLEHCELSLVIVGDRAIRKLNRDFRAKDQATDVLSFPQFEDQAELKTLARGGAKNAPPIPIGDIVISIETASRQAREIEQSAAARLRTLLIHGLLHLTGYDHERSAAEARRMFKREHQLAELMGVAGSSRGGGRGVGCGRRPRCRSEGRRRRNHRVRASRSRRRGASADRERSRWRATASAGNGDVKHR